MKKALKILSILLSVALTVVTLPIMGLAPKAATNLKGDTNGDGKCDIADLLRVQKYISNTTAEITLSNADFDGNGVVDTIDYDALRQYLLNPSSLDTPDEPALFDGETTLTNIWQGGTADYSHYRIPGMVVTKKDTVIIYCEARTELSDWAPMDIFMQRSEDGGETFGEPIYLAESTSEYPTVNNPVMFVGKDNTLHLIYCRNYSVNGGDVWYRRSTDDGKTWSEPKNIAAATNPDYRNVFAVGPGHGICLSDGTLIAAAWLVPKSAGAPVNRHYPSEITTIYSKDNGETWQMGDIIPFESNMTSPNESSLVELEDGSVMINIRVRSGKYRAVAYSPNGYSNWTTAKHDTNLIDPTCFGSTVKLDRKDLPYTVLFVNCESQTERSNLTLKGSTDGGKTWPLRYVVDSGAAGYADVAVDSRGCIYVLYEANKGESTHLARLSYRTLSKNIECALKTVTIDGTELEGFNPTNFLYSFTTDKCELVINAKAFLDNSEITVDDKPCTGEGVAVEITDSKVKSVLITVKSKTGETNTYILRLRNPSLAAGNRLIAHYDLSQTDSEYLLDASGNYNIIPLGGTSIGNEGSRTENSLIFSGNGNALQLNNGYDTDFGADAFSVSMWVKPSTVSGVKILYWYGDVGSKTSGTWIRINEGKLQFNINQAGNTEKTVTTTEKIVANEWTHICAVRKENSIAIYINGILSATDTIPNYNITATNRIYIGYDPKNLRNFVGSMEDIRIYKGAYTEEEINGIISLDK